MKFLRRIFDDISKYREYIFYAAKAELKNEVAGSYLGWIWWILDPLFFMLVYTFVVRVIFQSGGPEFPVFVFIGLTVWNFFNISVSSSVGIIRSYKNIISRIYVPKYILVITKMTKDLVKMGISLLLVLGLMLIFKINYSLMMLFVFPLTALLFIITFSISVISAHIGVFVSDFSNILKVILRFGFYVSGIIFSIDTRFPEPYSTIMYHINPISIVAREFRNVMIYQTMPSLYYFLYWAIIGLGLSLLAIYIMYKFENVYVKVA